MCFAHIHVRTHMPPPHPHTHTCAHTHTHLHTQRDLQTALRPSCMTKTLMLGANFSCVLKAFMRKIQSTLHCSSTTMVFVKCTQSYFLLKQSWVKIACNCCRPLIYPSFQRRKDGGELLSDIMVVQKRSMVTFLKTPN